MGYTAILVVLTALLSYLLLVRNDFDVTLLRTPGMTFLKMENDTIANMYNFDVINKTFNNQDITIKVVSPKGATISMVNGSSIEHMNLAADEMIKTSCMIKLPQSAISSNNSEIQLEITGNEDRITFQTNFVAPVYKK
jgi:polyferredoxin